MVSVVCRQQVRDVTRRLESTSAWGWRPQDRRSQTPLWSRHRQSSRPFSWRCWLLSALLCQRSLFPTCQVRMNDIMYENYTQTRKIRKKFEIMFTRNWLKLLFDYYSYMNSDTDSIGKVSRYRGSRRNTIKESILEESSQLRERENIISHLALRHFEYWLDQSCHLIQIYHPILINVIHPNRKKVIKNG